MPVPWKKSYWKNNNKSECSFQEEGEISFTSSNSFNFANRGVVYSSMLLRPSINTMVLSSGSCRKTTTSSYNGEEEGEISTPPLNSHEISRLVDDKNDNYERHRRDCDINYLRTGDTGRLRSPCAPFLKKKEGNERFHSSLNHTHGTCACLSTNSSWKPPDRVACMSDLWGGRNSPRGFGSDKRGSKFSHQIRSSPTTKLYIPSRKDLRDGSIKVKDREFYRDSSSGNAGGQFGYLTNPRSSVKLEDSKYARSYSLCGGWMSNNDRDVQGAISVDGTITTLRGGGWSDNDVTDSKGCGGPLNYSRLVLNREKERDSIDGKRIQSRSGSNVVPILANKGMVIHPRFEPRDSRNGPCTGVGCRFRRNSSSFSSYRESELDSFSVYGRGNALDETSSQGSVERERFPAPTSRLQPSLSCCTFGGASGSVDNRKVNFDWRAPSIRSGCSVNINNNCNTNRNYFGSASNLEPSKTNLYCSRSSNMRRSMSAKGENNVCLYGTNNWDRVRDVKSGNIGGDLSTPRKSRFSDYIAIGSSSSFVEIERERTSKRDRDSRDKKELSNITPRFKPRPGSLASSSTISTLSLSNNSVSRKDKSRLPFSPPLSSLKYINRSRRGRVEGYNINHVKCGKRESGKVNINQGHEEHNHAVVLPSSFQSSSLENVSENQRKQWKRHSEGSTSFVERSLKHQNQFCNTEYSCNLNTSPKSYIHSSPSISVKNKVSLCSHVNRLHNNDSFLGESLKKNQTSSLPIISSKRVEIDSMINPVSFPLEERVVENTAKNSVKVYKQEVTMKSRSSTIDTMLSNVEPSNTSYSHVYISNCQSKYEMITADNYSGQLPLTCLNLVNEKLSNKVTKVIKELSALVPINSSKNIINSGTTFLPSTEHILKGISCLESQINLVQNETDKIERDIFAEHKNNEFERKPYSLTMEVDRQAKLGKFYITSEFQKNGKYSEEKSCSVVKNPEISIGKDLVKKYGTKKIWENKLVSRKEETKKNLEKMKEEKLVKNNQKDRQNIVGNNRILNKHILTKTEGGNFNVTEGLHDEIMLVITKCKVSIANSIVTAEDADKKFKVANSLWREIDTKAKVKAKEAKKIKAIVEEILNKSQQINVNNIDTAVTAITNLSEEFHVENISDQINDAKLSSRIKSILDLTMDKPGQMINLVSSIITENQKKAKESHLKMLPIYIDKTLIVPEGNGNDDFLTEFSAWKELADQVTGPGNALYIEPIEVPYFSDHVRNYTSMKYLVREYVRSKKRKLFNRWVELGHEYIIRQQIYDSNLMVEKIFLTLENDGRDLLKRTSPALRSDTSHDRSNSNIYKRPRRTGTMGTVFSGCGDVVRSDYEQDQMLSELMAKDAMEKRISQGRSKLTCQCCHIEKELFVMYRDSISNKRIYDPSREVDESRYLSPWTDMEKCIFLDRFLQHPKDFRKIASFLRNKTVKDCISFYYDSKKTVPYKAALKEHILRRKRRYDAINWDATTKAAVSVGAVINKDRNSENSLLFSLPNNDYTYYTYNIHPLKLDLFESLTSDLLKMLYYETLP